MAVNTHTIKKGDQTWSYVELMIYLLWNMSLVIIYFFFHLSISLVIIFKSWIFKYSKFGCHSFVSFTYISINVLNCFVELFILILEY